MVHVLPWFVLAGFGLPLAWTDIRQHRLPNPLVAALTVAFLVTIVLAAVSAFEEFRLLRALAGGVVLFTIFLIVALAHPPALGMGDVKLSFVIGFALTWLGWDWLWLGSVLAFAGAAGWGALRRLTTRSREPIPLGPWLIGSPLGCAVLALLI